MSLISLAQARYGPLVEWPEKGGLATKIHRGVRENGAKALSVGSETVTRSLLGAFHQHVLTEIVDVIIQIILKHHPVLIAEIFQHRLTRLGHFRARLEVAGAGPGIEARGAEHHGGADFAEVFTGFELLIRQLDMGVGAVVEGLVGGVGHTEVPR